MPLIMTRPTRHPKSGVYRLRKAIPIQLRPVAKRLFGVERELVVSLGTTDAAEARRLAPRHIDDLERRMAAIRAAADNPPQSLSHMQVHAVAGLWYKDRIAACEATPGDRESWELQHEHLLEARPRNEEDGSWEDYEPTAKDLTEAESILAERGIVADTTAVRAVSQALWLAKVQLSETMMRRATGDYGRDNYAARFPDAANLPVKPERPIKRSKETPSVSFDDIVNGWARDAGHNPDAKPTPRPYYDRVRTAARLAAFLGHNEAAGVTKAEAVRWKADMHARGKAAATVANDLSEMSAVWKWAIAHGQATENPFAGILPPKKARNRKATRRPFTEAEAGTILAAARLESGALRWLPWVLAATGARLSEVCQGVKGDVIERDGLPFLRIHADDETRAAGEAQRSVKNEGSERMVPIHPRLAAEGFLAYVAALPAGSPLFPNIPPDKLFGQRGTSAQKLMGRWLRNKLNITDKKISPSHSWRHWFIDKARTAGMHPEIRNAITGHADDGNESHRYGLGWKALPQVLADAMAKIAFPAEL